MTLFGGKGGGASSFKQQSDTLRSIDTFEGILGICCGPIVGPLNGLKSIYLDGTPLEDASGTLNFTDMTAIMADGNPGSHPQLVTPQLGAGGSPVSVNLAIGNTNPAGTPGPWVVKTISNTNADFIDIRIIVNQLYKQDAKGIYAAIANLELNMKPTGMTNWIAPQVGIPSTTYSPTGVSIPGNLTAYLPNVNFLGGYGSSWVPEANNGYVAISGKTTSPFVYEMRIAVPKGGPYAGLGWDVRLRLREVESLDADPNFEKRTLQWESLSAVYSGTMGGTEEWRALAWLQIIGKASNQLSGIPEVTGIYKTKIVQVPPSGVFNPATRLYSGTTWDGSWASAFTTDPAWIINDALSDAISGMSVLAPGSHLNKWDALEASKYFSEQVPDGGGLGGTHCRYNLNLVVDQQQKASEFIPYMAGAVGGFAWEVGNGEWRMKVDKAENPTDIFTLENIIGEFTYSHTDVDTRYNDIKMTFLNEAMNYQQDSVHLYDNTAIAAYGQKPTTIVGIGCTNRQEAMRRTKLRLRTSVNETKMVSFSTNRRGRLLSVFNTILVADSDLGTVTTGRVLTVDTPRTTITVRDPIRLEIGVAYQIRFTIPNPNYSPDMTSQPANVDWRSPTITQTIALTNTSGQCGDVLTLYLATALPTTVAEYLAVALEATALPTLPKLYRIIDWKVDDNNKEQISIVAMEVDTGKWAASDAVSPTDSILIANTGAVPPPTDGAAVLSTVPNHFSLFVNWRRPGGRFIAGYRVRYQLNDGPWEVLAPSTTDSSAELWNLVTGVYTFEICTLDFNGRLSLPLIITHDVTAYDVEEAILLAAAKASADAANAELAIIASDNVLSQGEKPRVIMDRDVILAEQAGIDARATATGITTEKTAYDTAITALTTYLATLTTPTLWSSLTGNTTIVGATFTGKFKDVYATRQTLLSKIASQGSMAGYLSNENVTLSATYAGVVSDFTPAAGNFNLIDGITPVTSGVTYSVYSSTGVTVAINSTTGAYTVSAMSADNALATLRAVYQGLTIDKVFTLSKSKGGLDGSPAKVLTITSTGQTITYDNAGALSPSTQDNVFTALKQNTTATVTWTVKDANGTARTPTSTYLSAATGDTTTMTAAQFNSARNGTLGVSVTGTLTDGTTLYDTISVAKVQSGTNGTNGTNGATGTAGTNGTNGTNGTPGADAVTFYQSGTPTATAVGQIWYNTTTKLFYRWDGSAWVQMQGDLSSLNTVNTVNFVNNATGTIHTSTLGSALFGNGSNWVTAASVTLTPDSANSVLQVIANYTLYDSSGTLYDVPQCRIIWGSGANTTVAYLTPNGAVNGTLVTNISGISSSVTFSLDMLAATWTEMYAGGTISVLELKKAA
jgi:predicted phage tail protein